MVIPQRDIVVVHLVDRSIKGRKVKSKHFWELINKVMRAKKVDAKVNSARAN